MIFQRHYKIIKKSGLFDERYYLTTYEDVRKADIDPIKHYLNHGWEEGRNPSEKFDTNFYLETYPDVKAARMNPLIHFIKFGVYEDRKTHSEKSFGLQIKRESKIQKIIKLYKYIKQNPHLVKRFIREVKFNGFKIALYKALYKIDKTNVLETPIFKNNINDDFKITPYLSWISVNKLTKNRLDYLKMNLDRCSYKPLISIIIPVYNPPMDFLKKAITSIQNQFYKNFEICIVDDCSTDENVKHFLDHLQQSNSNIKVKTNSVNSHISITTNNAVDLADGEYLVFLDQDDELTNDALAEIVLYLNKNKNCDLLYSDHDKIDTSGNRFDPEFKPSWSSEYLLSFMYCGHLKCVSKELFLEVDGFRRGFEGSQDYDFYLRASEQAKHIGHIPRVLYHWRVIPGSTAAGGNEKSYSFQAGVNALQEALERRKVTGKAYHPEWALKNGNGIYAIDFPNTGKSVAIIIPTKNGYDLLKRCVDSLKKTTYLNYKIYIINNESDDQKTINYLNSLKYCQVLNIQSPKGQFNFSYINNEAVKKVTEELILFLNNDTEVINPKWLSQMVGYLQFQDVGSVGAKLFFPDDRIQHAGIIHNLVHGFPYISGRLAPSWDGGYMSTNFSSKNYMAVTAACMLTPKSLFLELGGFDEENFAVAYNDCDYGYKLVTRNYRNVLAPDATLYHYEGLTRGYLDKPLEEKNYVRKYATLEDRYYNKNFKINTTDYSIDATSLVLHKVPKFRIALFTHNMNMEGAPRFIYDLACTLKKQDIIEPVVISACAGPLKIHYDQAGVENYILDNFSLFSLIDRDIIDQFLMQITEFIKSLSVDVVYGNTIQGFWIVQSGKMLNLPSILNIHESEEAFSPFNYSPYIKELAIDALAFAYKVIFVSDASMDVYQHLETRNNFISIRNGFDHSKIKTKTSHLNRKDLRNKYNLNDKVNLLLLGTVCERKGQRDIIESLEYFNQQDLDNVIIHIVGDRKSLAYSQDLHTRVKQLPEILQQKIKIFDETPEDIYHFYIMADMFVCTSRIESFPKVIQEAMYFQLPIVTTPVFGIKELLKDRVSALFFEPGDAKKLASKITALLQDKAYRDQLALNANISLEICSTNEEMVNKYQKIIQEAWLS